MQVKFLWQTNTVGKSILKDKTQLSAADVYTYYKNLQFYNL